MNETRLVTKLAVLCAFACIVPAYAMLTLPKEIVRAGAEDDCRYFYGAYALSEVLPDNSGPIHGVLCVYR